MRRAKAAVRRSAQRLLYHARGRFCPRPTRGRTMHAYKAFLLLPVFLLALSFVIESIATSRTARKPGTP